MKTMTKPRRIIGQLLAAAAVATVLVAAACGGDSASDSKCNPVQTSCNGVCVNAYTDPQNCGACGNVCGPASVCSHGICASVCAAGDEVCAVDGGGFCTNTKSDNFNCGACGTPCKPQLKLQAARVVRARQVRRRLLGGTDRVPARGGEPVLCEHAE